MKIKRKRHARRSPRALAVLLATLMLASVAVPSALAAYEPRTDSDGDEMEPDPFIAGNVTIGTQKLSVCGEDVLCYEDDAGEEQNLADDGYALNKEHVDEPIQFYPQKVDCQYYGEDATSATTKRLTSAWCGNVSDKNPFVAGDWTEANEANDTFDITTRDGAHAIHIKNVGTNPGTADTDTYTLDFSDITTDASKLRLVVGLEAISLANSIKFRVYDGNGTGYEEFLADKTYTTKVAGTAHYLMNSTGTILQDALVSDGDSKSGGVTDDIGKIEIIAVSDSGIGTTEVYIWALSLDVKRYQFGVDENNDPVYNMTYTGCDGDAKSTPEAKVCLTSFDWADPTGGDGHIRFHDTKIAYRQDASALEDDQVTLLTGDRDDDAFPFEINYRFTFEQPEQIDLTWADDTAFFELPVAGSQYSKAELCGSDVLSDVEDEKSGKRVNHGTPSWSEGSTTDAPDRCEIEYTQLFTQSQWEEVTTEQMAGSAFFGAGTLLGGFTDWVLGGVIAIAGIFGARAWARSRFVTRSR